MPLKTVLEVAKHLRIKASKVRKLIDQEVIPAVFIPGTREPRLNLEKVERALEMQPMRAKSAMLLDDGNFTHYMKRQKGLFVVVFWATWSPDSEAYIPKLERVLLDMGGRVRYGKVDCTKAPKVCRKMAVKQLPCVLLYESGLVCWRADLAPSLLVLRREIEKRLPTA